MTSKQLEAALELAQRGVRQFPQDRNKRPIIKGWPEAATTDEAQLRAWAKDHPTANFAAACGKDSGILVVDVDVKNDQPGLESLERLRETVGNLATYIVRTPSGGMHLYFKYPDGADRIKNLAELDGYPGIELKADRGCVTVAGSFYASGAEYVLVHDGEFAPLPAQLLELVKAKHSTTKTLPRDKSAGADGPINPSMRNSSMASLAGTMRRRGMSEDSIKAALLVENAKLDLPLEEEEVEKVVRSIGGKDAAPQLLHYNFTELGNSERLVALFGEDIAFCNEWGAWLTWDGRYWCEDKKQSIAVKAMQVCREMYRQAGEIEDQKAREALVSWALRSESQQARNVMLKSAEPLRPVTQEALDADPYILGVNNCVIDLHSGEAMDFSRDRWMLKCAPVDLDDEAECPKWDQFLLDIFNGDVDLIGYVQRAVGYALTGDTGEQVWFLLHGSGANGKSTFINTLLGLLGPYALFSQAETFMATQRHAGQASPELAALQSVRFLGSIETQEGRKLNEPLLKQLTGGDPVQTRRLYHEYFTFQPEFKLFLACNHRPIVTGTDYAIWRRIRLVPFEVEIPEAARIKDYHKHLLEAESPGILNWAIRGCLDWQANGMKEPKAVLMATRDYRSSQDVIADFVDECLEASGTKETKAAVYRRFKRWCEDNGEKVETKRWLTTKMRERGYRDDRLVDGTRAWANVTVIGDQTGV